MKRQLYLLLIHAECAGVGRPIYHSAPSNKQKNINLTTCLLGITKDVHWTENDRQTFPNKKVDCITIVDVRGFLFARTIQHPRSIALVSTSIVSTLAEQSTMANPTSGWIFNINNHQNYEIRDAVLSILV